MKFFDKEIKLLIVIQYREIIIYVQQNTSSLERDEA